MAIFGLRKMYIDAIQFNRENLEECLEFCEGELINIKIFEEGTLIGWLYGRIIVSGDYIIKTDKHYLLIMGDDLFESLFVEW